MKGKINKYYDEQRTECIVLDIGELAWLAEGDSYLFVSFTDSLYF